MLNVINKININDVNYVILASAYAECHITAVTEVKASTN